MLVLLLTLLSAPVRAQEFDAALDRFLNDSFPETEAGIAAIQGSGDPRGAAVLEALLDRRLLVVPADKRVLVRDRAGQTTDARTGAAASDIPTNPVVVRLNNRLRGMAQAA